MFLYLQKNFNVSRGTYEKLEIYQSVLLRWQKAVNLVSRGTLDDFWQRHIIDSLQIMQFLRGKKILDIGSGGGFPGMVLAICGNFDVTCLDSDTKKNLFLEEVARLTKTTVNVTSQRIENFTDNSFDTVTARGFSELTNLLKYTLKHSKNGYGVFPKGAKITEEIIDAEKKYNFSRSLFDSITNRSGKIIIVENISQISSQEVSKFKDI
ncbi:MAG: 16S rRNA (guanine(527)-N(7))-methyltransferase RsmG [Holosporaceae bacterium]|jgi:16S rRNA (guanine527-N7)-methyltransferase|nr:16S rRNA (guanine(527)-N(7))-methyltransferase RsmG [Holosporaceae bacterium]